MRGLDLLVGTNVLDAALDECRASSRLSLQQFTSMKTIRMALAALSAAAIASFLGATRLDLDRAPASSPLATVLAGPGVHAAIVRAEYANFNGREAYTVCRLANLSVSQNLVLKQVVVLGAGGVGSVMTVYNGLFGQTLPPLGSLELRLDNSIPGVVQQSTATGGVRQVVFLWEGDAESMHLTASIESWLQTNLWTRSEVIERGQALQP